MRRWLALLVVLALPGATGATTIPLANAGFDTDLSGWTGSTASHDPADVAGSALSGSALLTGTGSLQQCVAVGPGTARAEVWTLIPSGQTAFGLASVSLTFFAQAGCAGQPFNTQLFAPIQPAAGAWALLERENEVPAGALSVTFQVGIVNASGPFMAHFDDASLTLVPEPGMALLAGLGLAILAIAQPGPGRRAGRHGSDRDGSDAQPPEGSWPELRP